MGFSKTVASTLTCFALSGALAGAQQRGTAIPPGSHVTGHLFIATQTEQLWQVLRFPIVDDKTVYAPDRAYLNVSPPIAVGPDGALYGAITSDYNANIVVYAKDAYAPSHYLYLPAPPPSYYGYDTAMTVDRAGYLFVSHYYEGSADAKRPINTVGTFVYAPGSKGYDKPLRTIGMPNAFGMSTDAKGSLYVANVSEVDVYDTPVKRPKLARKIFGSTFQGQNVAEALTIDGTTLYVFDGPYGGGPSQDVSAYAAASQGPVNPLRTISLAGNLAPSGAVGVSGIGLFVPLMATNDAAFLEYNKYDRGRPRIIDQGAYGEPLAIAAGP
ncbi:MAG: hypothetical protein ABI346_01290 [Candidatus Baltobacteraceae bacterium]